jgi:hypothetical protein
MSHKLLLVGHFKRLCPMVPMVRFYGLASLSDTSWTIWLYSGFLLSVASLSLCFYVPPSLSLYVSLMNHIHDENDNDTATHKNFCKFYHFKRLPILWFYGLASLSDTSWTIWHHIHDDNDNDTANHKNFCKFYHFKRLPILWFYGMASLSDTSWTIWLCLGFLLSAVSLSLCFYVPPSLSLSLCLINESHT